MKHQIIVGSVLWIGLMGSLSCASTTGDSYSVQISADESQASTLQGISDEARAFFDWAQRILPIAKLRLSVTDRIRNAKLNGLSSEEIDKVVTEFLIRLRDTSIEGLSADKAMIRLVNYKELPFGFRSKLKHALSIEANLYQASNKSLSNVEVDLLSDPALIATRLGEVAEAAVRRVGTGQSLLGVDEAIDLLKQLGISNDLVIEVHQQLLKRSDRELLADIFKARFPDVFQ